MLKKDNDMTGSDLKKIPHLPGPMLNITVEGMEEETKNLTSLTKSSELSSEGLET